MHHRKYSNFLILSFVAISIFGFYRYFSSDLKATAATSSGITSSLNDNSDPTFTSSDASINKKTLEDISFLKTLSSLNKIKIDTSLFEDRNFRLLVDNNIKLEKAPYGRANPFLPVDKIVSNDKPAFLLSTLPATGITKNSAQLNASIEGATSNNIYFEYGPIETFGKTTQKVVPSLVGGLVSSVNQLSSKTKYFYRVVASVNGVITYGDSMSFVTN